MADDPGQAARRALALSRRAALDLAHGAGAKRTIALLRASAEELEQRIARLAPGVGDGSYSIVQLRATLEQVRHVLKEVTLPALRDVVVEEGDRAATESARHTVDYLEAADRAYRGVGEQPIALRTASMLESAQQGARSSVLSRLVHGVERRGRKTKRVKMGILARYGVETVAEFERALQVGLVTKKSWIEMRGDLTKVSPFLRGKPAWWAHRIVRTEVMGAYGAAAHHSIASASQQLPDMLKILSETFDDRTAWDSYNDHGEVRLPEEEFEFVSSSGESWEFMHPPNRPNDRSVVLPHRARWPLPDELRPRTQDEVEEAWAREHHKGEMPDRPEMSTVEGFGEAD